LYHSVRPNRSVHHGNTIVDTGATTPIDIADRSHPDPVSGHTGKVKRSPKVPQSSTTARLTRLIAATLGVVAGVMLMAWGMVGCGGTGSPTSPGNEALGGPFTSSSAASIQSSDLRAAFNGDPVQLRYAVLDEIPADPSSFTQGLEFTPDGRLFESTGLYGRSALRQLDPDTGATVDEVAVDPTWFAEGITLVDDGGTALIAMLTWREGVVAFYDPDTLTERRRATYTGEGWGLCQLDDGTLVMSNGTPVLTLRDPATFAINDRVTVTRSGTDLSGLNELECAGGLVWANVWQTDQIVVIDPLTGNVLAELDASGIRTTMADPGANVLNGIALVPGTTDEFWLAGKYWRSTWVVRVRPA
jgi:glutaminyl-peptide cyclotransferase